MAKLTLENRVRKYLEWCHALPDTSPCLLRHLQEIPGNPKIGGKFAPRVAGIAKGNIAIRYSKFVDITKSVVNWDVMDCGCTDDAV
jgi:hypothetical protein